MQLSSITTTGSLYLGDSVLNILYSASGATEYNINFGSTAEAKGFVDTGRKPLLLPNAIGILPRYCHASNSYAARVKNLFLVGYHSLAILMDSKEKAEQKTDYIHRNPLDE